MNIEVADIVKAGDRYYEITDNIGLDYGFVEGVVLNSESDKELPIILASIELI